MKTGVKVAMLSRVTIKYELNHNIIKTVKSENLSKTPSKNHAGHLLAKPYISWFDTYKTPNGLQNKIKINAQKVKLSCDNNNKQNRIRGDNSN